MKITIKPQLSDEGLCIPNKIVRKTTLANAEKAFLYANEAGVLLLNEALTAWQIIKTVDMLNTVATSLIMRLENAAREHEERCRRICVPEELLKMAGIPKGAPLSIETGDGEIFISVADEEDDPAERLPSFLRDLLEDSHLDFGALRFLLNGEEPIHE